MAFYQQFYAAESLVAKYFEGKVDKGGNDYRYHLYDVANRIEKSYSFGVDREKGMIVGLLHNILEDTECTVETLKENGFDDEIIDAIVAITRRKDEHSYFDFINRVKSNEIARVVKIYDLENNMDIRRLSKLEEKDLKRLKKYWYCWKYLKDEIDEETCINSLNNKI